MTSEVTNLSQRQLWRAAIKLPLYSVAIIPVWVGTAVAFQEIGTINQLHFWTFLGSIICIQIWINLANDVFDDDTGVDIHKYHSVVQLTGKKNAILWLSNSFLLLGILATSLIAWWQQDITLLIIVLIGCFLGHSYQGPPFRFSYQGIGEIICFISYALLVDAAYYAQTSTWSTTNVAASIIIGLATSLILFCAHFHQFEDDLAGNKYSPIVRLGTAKAATFLPWWAAITYSLIPIFVWLKLLPIWTLTSLLSSFYAVKLCLYVSKYHDQPTQVSNCKFIAVAMYFWLGFLLVIGLIIPQF